MSQQLSKRRLGWVVAILVAIAVAVLIVVLGPCPPGKPVPAAVPTTQATTEPEEQEGQPDPELVSHGSTSR